MAVRPDATSKNPSLPPRKGEEDLEQYGVWVKAEPQDIAEETESLRLDSLDSAPGQPPAGAGLGARDSFLTEDEEKLLGSFEELDTEDSSNGPAMTDMPDMENLPPLDEFEIKDEAASDVEDLGASIIDISLDDLETTHEPAHSIRPDAAIDMSSIKGLDSVDLPTQAPASHPSIIEDVSAEFLDLGDEPSGPSGAPAGEPSDVTSEFLDAEPLASEPKPRAPAEPEFETIDMELHFDDTIAHAGKGRPSDEPGFEEVSDFDDFLASEEPENAAPAARAHTSAPPAAFDDLAAVEEELASPVSESRPARAAAAAAPAESQMANELLRKIAEELSSIRSELVNLKGQIVAIKEEGLVAAPPAAPCEPAEEPEEDHEAPKVAGGFFDEEEDETIALTGDELDNILNSANFTEESITGEEAPFGATDEALTDELILPENGDYQAKQEEPAIEEINLEPAEILPESAEEEEDLSPIDFVSDEEIRPMTQAPEDTSYLEEPLPEEEALDLSEIPLHEEPLLAPEPLSFAVEESEPIGLDSEELPVVPEAEQREGGELPDLALSMDSSMDYTTENVPEAESLPPIEEFEEVSFGEINLGEESLEQPSTEEIEELGAEDLYAEAAPEPGLDALSLEEDIEAKTVKPSQPVAFHPDEIPMSLDDSFFVGAPRGETAEEKAVEEEPLVEEQLEEVDFSGMAAEMTAPATEEEALPSAEGRPSEGDDRLKSEIKGVLSYLDKLLESLPEDKIEEFARSEYFDTYKKLFEELGLV